jgi:hypothetical protein
MVTFTLLSPSPSVKEAVRWASGPVWELLEKRKMVYHCREPNKNFLVVRPFAY